MNATVVNFWSSAEAGAATRPAAAAGGKGPPVANARVGKSRYGGAAGGRVGGLGRHVAAAGTRRDTAAFSGARRK